MMKNVILCADDYGLNASISQGVIDLLRHQRLSAVSCMTTSPLWTEHAAHLVPFHNRVDIGLHFNLTEGKPLSALYRDKVGKQFTSLSPLIVRAFLRQLDSNVIEHECEAQLNEFRVTTGFLPNFIDGHQHVHQLPVVRDALLRVYQRHYRNQQAYIRSALNLSFGKIKNVIIYLCGAGQLKKLLNKYTIPHNNEFAGIYSFSQAARYSQVFPEYLKNIKKTRLIMCHPGLKDDTDIDVIADARYQEYTYLASDQFIKDCLAANIALSRFPSPEALSARGEG